MPRVWVWVPRHRLRLLTAWWSLAGAETYLIRPHAGPGTLSRVLALNQWTPLTIPNLGKGWVTQCFCSCVCLDNSAIVFRIMSCCVCVLVYPVWVNGLFCNYFVSIFAVKGPYWLLRFQEKCVNALFRKLPCCLIGSDYCTFTPE